MRLIEEMLETTQRIPDKTALFTEKSQLSFADIMRMVSLLDRALTRHGVKPGQLIVMDSNRGELCIAFSFLLSWRGLRVAFCKYNTVLMNGLVPDFWVTDTVDKPVQENQIIIDPSWFAGLDYIHYPDLATLHSSEGFFSKLSINSPSP